MQCPAARSSSSSLQEVSALCDDVEAVGRFVEHEIARRMYERTRQCSFQFLTLRKTFGASIGAITEFEACDQFVGAGTTRALRHAV